MLSTKHHAAIKAKYMSNGALDVGALSGQFLAAIGHFNDDKQSAVEPKGILVEILSCYLYGDMELNAVLEMIKSAELISNPNAASVLTDILWMLGTQVSPDDSPAPDETRSTQWNHLCALVKRVDEDEVFPKDLLKLSLEFNLLSGAGIIKDEAAVKTKLIKCNTQLMYRQQKYNLLREESEGYSKLLTLLCTIPAPPLDASAHIRHITSVIGYFDLDPNRVLDITLDAFEHQLWNMSFVDVLQIFKKGSIVHILGFKFSRYHVSSTDVSSAENKAPTPKGGESGPQADKAAPAADPCAAGAPHSLYLLAVVLIAHRLVDLPLLIPYLSPSSADTGSFCQAEEFKIISELKSFGVVSLSSKGADKSSTTATSSAPVIASALPSVGAYANGNQLFGMLAAAYEMKLWDLGSELQDFLLTGGCHCASSFCDEVKQSLIELVLWRTESMYAAIGFRNFKLGSSLPSKVCNENKDSIPNLPGQCTQVRDLNDFIGTIGPMLYCLSHHLGTSPELYTRCCRILEKLVRRSDSTDTEPGAMEIVGECSNVPSDVTHLLSNVILPALTRSKSVAAPFSQMLWSVVRHLPFQVRFSLYHDWEGCGLGKDGLNPASGQEKKDPILCFAEVKVLVYAKSQLKRLSKDNVKQMSRTLSNATHSCPLISYTHILNSIQVFDNLIPFVVDALKYTTDLSRDVMAYALIIQLQKDSEKLKPGDTHYSQWFSSLAKFVATFYRKYPSTCLEGLLHFLVGSLSKGESLDLLVLRELLTKMGGCETMLDVSHSQLEGLSGGKALQAETMGGQVKEATPKKAIRYLRDELIKTATAFPLLYLTSKIRSTIIFNLDTPHLKLVSHMHDVCQDVLMQFTEFLVMGGLSGSGTTEKMEKLNALAATFPSLQELLHVGGLSLGVAFQLIRPLVRLALQSCYTADGSEVGDKRPPNKAKVIANACLSPEKCPSHLQRWHPFSPNILEAITSAYAEGKWPEGISVEFLSLFWSLSTYDLKVPVSRYQLEAKRLRDRCSELDGSGKPSADDMEKTKSQRSAELKKIETSLKSILAELDTHKEHVEIIKEILLFKKDTFFLVNDDKASLGLNEHFIQHCVLPRMFLSPVDAVFGSQFFAMLHNIQTPKYRFLSFVDRFMKLNIPLIFSSTEYEAAFLGHAINDILEKVNRWTDSSTFARELPSENFQKFTAIYGMWNIRLKNVIKNGIESKEYMIIRSSMVLLSKIIQNFPSRRKVGTAVLDAVEILQKAETGRSDLALMAKSLTTMLKRSAGSWIDDEPKKPISVAPSVASTAADDSNMSAPTAQSSGKKIETKANTATKLTSSSNGSAKGQKEKKEAEDKEQKSRGKESRDRDHSRDNNSKDKDRDQPKEEAKQKTESKSKSDSKAKGESKSKSDSKSKGETSSTTNTDGKGDANSAPDSNRTGSRDRNSSRESTNEARNDPGKGPSDNKQVSDRGTERPAKREREESGSSMSSRSGAPPRDQRGHRDREVSKASSGGGQDSHGASRRPISSRLGAGNDPNDSKGQRGKDSTNSKERDEPQHPSKRARR